MTTDGYFTDQQLAAVWWVLREQLGGENNVDLAYLGGSLAVGLGNELSDVDLYVVADELDVPAAYEYAHILIHVEVVPASKIETLVERVREYRTSSTDKSQILMDFKTLYFLVHLVTGRTLIRSPAWASFLDRIDMDVVRQVMVTRYAYHAAAAAQDAAGALRSSDPYSALAGSYEALAMSAEALLAATNDVYSSQKFLLRRLARAPIAQNVFSRIWQLLHGVDAEVHKVQMDNTRELVEARLAMASQLLASCVLHGWEKSLDGLITPPNTTYSGPRRNPYYFPVRLTDGMGLVGPEKSFQITPQLLQIWANLPFLPSGEMEIHGAVADLVAADVAYYTDRPLRNRSLTIERADTFGVYNGPTPVVVNPLNQAQRPHEREDLLS